MNTATKNQNPVTLFQQAEDKKGNGWAVLALAVALLNEAEAADYCEEQETAFKKNQRKEALPGAWRTAKSVALKAVRLGVPLLDAAGVPLGKTAIEKACKAKADAVAAAELAAIEADEAQAGELVVATAHEFMARFATLILAAKEAGFDPDAIFADAYARTLPTDAL